MAGEEISLETNITPPEEVKESNAIESEISPEATKESNSETADLEAVKEEN